MLLLKADSGVHLDFQELLSGKTQSEDYLRCEGNPTETAFILQLTALETSRPMPETDTPKASASANTTIPGILADISAQGEGSEEEKKQPSHNSKVSQSSSIPSSQQKEHADLMETVILSSTAMLQDLSLLMDHEKKGIIHEKADFDPDTTIAISPQFDPAATVQVQYTISENQSPRKESFNPSIKSRLEESLQETVMISPLMGQQRSHLKPSPLSENTGSETIHGGQASFPDGKTSDKDFAETIIQRPVKKP
jgi:hypothetical protein